MMTSGIKERQVRMTRIFLQTLVLMLVAPLTSQADQVGALAPSFNVMDLQGNRISLDGLRGKVVFLSFWAPWCLSCRKELPALDELHNKYGHDGLAVIGICVDGSEKSLAQFLRRTPVSFPLVLDKAGDVAETYRVSGLPAGFVIGRDGVIRHLHRGFGKEYQLLFEKEITELLKQQLPSKDR
jgi:peroxiredoxin